MRYFRAARIYYIGFARHLKSMIRSIGISRHNCDVQAIDIWRDGLSATILTWGAVVQDLRLLGHDAPLVLGFERLDDYLDHSLYFGAIVGRQANRIARGKFALDGERFETDRNDNGNTLHGGGTGLDRRVWRLADKGSDFVTLTMDRLFLMISLKVRLLFPIQSWMI